MSPEARDLAPDAQSSKVRSKGLFVQDVPALLHEHETTTIGAGHLFGLNLPPDVDPAAVKAHLQERNVFVSVRGRAIRVAPYLYNDASDLQALVSALEECGAEVRLT